MVKEIEMLRNPSSIQKFITLNKKYMELLKEGKISEFVYKESAMGDTIMGEFWIDPTPKQTSSWGLF